MNKGAEYIRTINNIDLFRYFSFEVEEFAILD
jgi:hypothetical protein